VTRLNSLDRDDVEEFITSKKFREDGIFKWEGKDGKSRQFYLKKNRSLVDRKMSHLMYLSCFYKDGKENGKKSGQALEKGTAVP